MFQLKSPLKISTIIEISDPVYIFCGVMDSIDLKNTLPPRKARRVEKDTIQKSCLK